MKEIFSISTGVNVAKTKPVSKHLDDVAINDEKAPTKDFLSIMFAQIKESIEVSKEDNKLSLKLDNLEDKIEKKSLDEHLLDDLLKVISLLKNHDSKIKLSSFPSLSNKLEKLINSETAIKELKEVKNITDLLKLSKKYDLGLEKISVKNLDFKTIKKEFPELAKKDFFNITKEENNTKAVTASKKEVETKPTVLSINNIEKPKTEVKKELTLFEKIMSTPKEEKKEPTIQVNKETIKDKVIEDKKEIATVKVAEEIKKTVKTVQEEAPKVVSKEIEAQVKKELHVKKDTEIKRPDITRISEPKTGSNIPKKGMIENILQGIKPEKKQSTSTTTIAQSLDSNKLEKQGTENSEIKMESISSKVDLKPQIKTDTIASKQLSPSRDTFSNFANDFKEKLENYKPPFMRIQLALSPKGLGEVDVTIINRGSNLHVNITSNTNTMSVFTQNQAEFKNSLVNMGFTNLEMNFSDQREKNQHQNKASKESNDFFEEENLEEGTTNIELIVPKYV